MSRVEELKAELAREIERQSPATFTNEEKARLTNALNSLEWVLYGLGMNTVGGCLRGPKSDFEITRVKALEDRIAALEATAARAKIEDAMIHVPGANGVVFGATAISGNHDRFNAIAPRSSREVK